MCTTPYRAWYGHNREFGYLFNALHAACIIHIEGPLRVIFYSWTGTEHCIPCSTVWHFGGPTKACCHSSLQELPSKCRPDATGRAIHIGASWEMLGVGASKPY
jgi:hypothetical protein